MNLKDIQLGSSDGEYLGLRACLNCHRADRLSIKSCHACLYVRCDCGTKGSAEKLLSSAVYAWQCGPHSTANGILLVETPQGIRHVP